MKKIFLGLLLIVLGFSGINSTYSVVAYPYPTNVQQSDKTTVTVLLKGDEKVSWAKTTDGYTLLRSENGDFVYAIPDEKGGMKPSIILCHNVGQRSQEELNFISKLNKKLFYSKEQVSILKQMWVINDDFQNKTIRKTAIDSVENYKMVVILMSFSDTPFATSREDVEELYNQVGYSKLGHAGSVHDYFNASSNGHLNLTATVLGPYTAQYGIQYYGKDTTINGNNYQDYHVRELIREAVNDADPYIDYSQYTNGDGNQVSCVYVLYAGVAQSAGNASYTIWPHRSVVYPAISVDNVIVYNYGCSSEYEGYYSYPQPLKIGTICHEFSHVLGQPDYYDTDYETNGQTFDPGTWDIMASGNYNHNSMFPPLWSAIEKEVRGYVKINEVSDEGSNTLPNLDKDARAYKLSFDNNEYFLLENRQQIGWDTYLPGHGLLIYHVDKTVSGWSSNCINCNPNNQGYKLMTADNSTTTHSTGNCFPGTTNNTSFTDTSTPNSISNSSANLNKPITSIAENTTTGNITFIYGTVASGRPVVVTNSTTVEIDTVKVNATITNGSSLTITEKGVCYSDTTNIPTINCNTITANSTTNAYNINLLNLTPNTTYYVRAYAKTNAYVGYGEIMKIQTPCSSYSTFPLNVSFEENETNINCWNQECGTYIANKWAFVDTTNVSGAITNAHSGNRFAYIHSDWTTGTQTVKLITNPLNISVLSQPILKFYHHQKLGTNQDILKIYYKTSASSSWTLLQTYSSNISSWIKDSIILPNKSKSYFIAFESTLSGGYGIGLDDIEITENNISAFPIVTTDTIKEITDNAANVYCTLVSSGYTSLQDKGIVISQNPNPTVENDSVIDASDNNIGAYIINLTNLTPSTQYYVRSFARNQGLTSYGEEKTFISQCQKINSFPYTPNLATNDTLCFSNEGGWIANNNDSSYSFSATTNNWSSYLTLPILNLSYKDSMNVMFSYKQVSSSLIDTLKVYYKGGVNNSWELLNTYYNSNTSYIRDTIHIPTLNHQNENSYIAFQGISKVGGEVKVKDVSIEAVSQIAFVSTDNTTLATYNSIATGGTITYSGMSNVTNRGICYSTSNNPTINNTIISSGSGVGTFTTTISNLSPLTTYYIRAFATNSYGTSYGEEKTITTPFIPIFNNTITSNQTICAGSVGATINGSTPTGGDGTYSYLWILSTDSINWQEANNGSVNTNKYFEPRQLFTTTYYRRIVTSNISIDTSDVVTITVNPTSKGGNVFALMDTVKEGNPLRLQLRAYTGDILYWERKRPNFDWEEVSNSADSIYFSEIPNTIGYYNYRAVVKSGVCNNATSGEDSIWVKENVGLNNINNNNYSITLSPNPTSGVIHLSCSGINEEKAVIIINDIKGDIVYKENKVLSNGDNIINLSFLPTGTYIIKINNNLLTWKTKVIIQK